MRYWHWVMVVLLSVGLAACGSGASGFAPPPGGSGTKATVSVTVLNALTNPQPLSQVPVLGEGETSPTLTGPDGRATVTVQTGQATRLFLQFSEGSQNIYPLTVPAGQQTAEVTCLPTPLPRPLPRLGSRSCRRRRRQQGQPRSSIRQTVRRLPVPPHRRCAASTCTAGLPPS